ncbi:MAG: metallophosphoesterase [Kofleriaceae bacterium]
MRATWLTDIHLNFLRPLALRAFYDRVKAERPDALLVTGDIAESDSFGRFVSELASHTGAHVYYVLGNHDYYRSSIRRVRDALARPIAGATWMPAAEPMRVGARTTLIGIDGWGDARCGDLGSTVDLSDWQLIEELARRDRLTRIETLQRLGSNEARALAHKLTQVPPNADVLVLTHVPPFAEACVYGGTQSEPGWLPWFTCIATGEVLLDHATRNPAQRITVLCGHSHGVGVCRPAPNLEVRTGGWPPNVEEYGNPVVQATLEL